MNASPRYLPYFPQILLSEFEKHVENHPQTFGNTASLTHSKFKKLKDLERQACRIAQLSSGAYRHRIRAMFLTTHIPKT